MHDGGDFHAHARLSREACDEHDRGHGCARVTARQEAIAADGRRASKLRPRRHADDEGSSIHAALRQVLAAARERFDC